MPTIIAEALDGFDEGLEIVQHLQDEAETHASDEYDALHNEIKDAIEVDKEVELQEKEVEADPIASDTPPDETAPSDAGSDESPASEGEETDDAPSEEVDDEGEPTDKTDEKPEPLENNGTAMESIQSHQLRESSYYTQIALEGELFTSALAGASVVGAHAWHASKYLYRSAYELGKYLGGIGLDLGKEYGPKLASKLKKGVIYLFSRSLKALFGTIAGIGDFVKRYRTSITRSQKDIAALQRSLAELKGAADKPYGLRREASTNTKITTWLSLKSSKDVRMSEKILRKFLTTVIENVDRGVSHDLEVIKRLIDLSAGSTRGNLLGYMDVTPLQGGFLKRNLKDYAFDPMRVDSLVYGDSLPNKTLFIANLPKRNLKTIEEIAEAYQGSGLFLAVNSGFEPLPDSMTYLSLLDLEAYLTSLNALCLLATQQMGLYSKIAKQCESLKLGYKHYAETLLASPEQQTVQSSLAEFIQLKQNFVNKSYLPAAMDVHDLVATYLVYAVRFAKANVKAFEQS